jgi:circadian clock protein KaiC
MPARVKTGIPGLDNMLMGGFLEGDSVIVAGSAGTGKTTFCLQYLVNGIIESNERGIFVSFEQLPEQVYRDALNFGWDLKKLEAENKFRFVCTSPQLLLGTDSGEQILDELISEFRPKRIAIDSLSHFELFVENAALREELYRLIMYLKTKRLSAVLTWETSNNTLLPGNDFNDEQLSFLVDCIILMRHVEIDSMIKKVLLILKMRGSNHDKQIKEYTITQNGIKVLPAIHGYEGVMSGSPRKSVMESASDGFKKAFSNIKEQSEKH